MVALGLILLLLNVLLIHIPALTWIALVLILVGAAFNFGLLGSDPRRIY